MGDCPVFFYQHLCNGKWRPYSYSQTCAINTAVKKRQKVVTIPDAKNKLRIDLEEMIQKNVESGYQQKVRVLIYNKRFISWSYVDDVGDKQSFTPLSSLYLEVAHAKNLELVDILIGKKEYETDIITLRQKEKNKDVVREIFREEKVLYGALPTEIGFVDLMRLHFESKKFIERMTAEDERSIKNIQFGLPVTRATGDTEMTDISEAIDMIYEPSTSGEATYVAVDPHCPKADNWLVYNEGSLAYHATLNLTSVHDNSNKFYNMQLLQNKNKDFAVWYHWGRVGYKGMNNLKLFYNNLDEAKSEFEKQFYDKTRNEFKDIKNFKRVASKYDLVDVDLSYQVIKQALPIAETKLDGRIQELLEMICNKKTLEEAAQEMSYDAKVTPLGKITAKQVKEGYIALQKVSEILKRKRIAKGLIDACNVFYTKIPHDFGRKTPPILDMEGVKDKLTMLEALSNIAVALDFMESTEGIVNPIDLYYKNLDCTLIALENESDEFKVIKESIENLHGPTHNYRVEISAAYKYIKETQFIDYGNKKLLWHGSRISNWLSILKNGLQIAPPEAPSTGYMFGKGIYFADVFSKSANYCFATKKKNEGLITLCEVSLGTVKEEEQGIDLTPLPADIHSVFGMGELTPTSFRTSVLSSEAEMAFGPLIPRLADNLVLKYNEYIVYDNRQVKIKYFIKLRFHFDV